jgi:hypothetical protein
MTNARAAYANHLTFLRPLNISSSSLSLCPLDPSPNPENNPAPSKDGRKPHEPPDEGRMRKVVFDPGGVKAGRRAM